MRELFPIVQVAFPTSGEYRFPDPKLFDSPRDFTSRTTAQGFDWIYHLTAQRHEGDTVSSVRRVTIATVNDILRVAEQELGIHGNFRVSARECFHGRDPQCQGGCTGNAFHPGCDWSGESYQLALAIALYAAAENEIIPPWVLFSGTLRPHTLQIGRIDSLIEKVHLALGKEQGTDHIEPLVRAMYQRERAATELCIGPETSRVFPGGVRLLIVGACDLNDLPANFPGCEQVMVSVRNYRSYETNEVLGKCIDRDAKDSLLVVSPPTVREALGLLGIRPRGDCEDILVGYKIPLQQGVSDRDKRRHWAYLQATCDWVQQSRPSPRDRLNTVLRLCCLEFDRRLQGRSRCFSGDIGLVPFEERNQGRLRVEARWGKGVDAIPYFYPSSVGITSRVLREGRTAIVPNTEKDVDFREACSENNPLMSEYSARTWEQYQAFLRQVKSCIKIPIQDGEDIVAVVSLHCNAPVESFAPNDVRFLVAFAQYAALDPIRTMRAADGSRRNPSDNEPGSYRNVIRSCFSGSLISNPDRFDNTRKALCQELAEFALRRAGEGAYRTAVRTLSQDGSRLEVQATIGTFDPRFYSDWHIVRIGDKARFAADHAIRHLLHVYIEDTDRIGIDTDSRKVPIEHYGPEHARAHASVLILYGTHILGVLSVDWRQQRLISPSLRDDLEQLACRYALAIKSLFVDARLSDLRKALAQEDLTSFVRLTGELIGAKYAALYRRNFANSLYELDTTACAGHSQDWLESDKQGYAPRGGPDGGFVGWVAKHGQELRVANRMDLTELATFHPPPHWRDGQGLVREWGDRVVAWMGVPVRGGGDILGVLRLANETRLEGFSSFDMATADVAAGLLGEYLFDKLEKPRRAKLLRFAGTLHTVTSSQELLELLFAFLDDTIAPYAGGLRWLDKQACADGSLRPAMRRLHARDRSWLERTPLFRQLNSGLTRWVYENRRRYLSSEEGMLPVDNLEVDVRTKDLLAGFAEHACYPLCNEQGDVCGTLHIARKDLGALAVVDGLCQEVANLVAPVLLRLDRERTLALEVALRRIAVEPGVQRFAETLRLLLRFSGAQTGLFWHSTPDSQMSLVETSAYHESLDIRDVDSLVGDGGIRLVSEPQLDSALHPYCAPAISAFPTRLIEQCHQAVLVIRRGDKIQTVYVLIASGHFALSYQALSEAHRVLEAIETAMCLPEVEPSSRIVVGLIVSTA